MFRLLDSNFPHKDLWDAWAEIKNRRSILSAVSARISFDDIEFGVMR